MIALAFQPVIIELERLALLNANIWYHDDGYIIATPDMASIALKCLMDMGPDVGYYVNIRKTAIISSNGIPPKPDDPLFPPELIRVYGTN